MTCSFLFPAALPVWITRFNKVFCFIFHLSSMLFKHDFILEQEFLSPYPFTVNQNSENESFNIQIYPLHFHLTYTMHSIRIHFPFTTHFEVLRWYYGNNTVVLRY
jgi:hypothetical protein